MRLFLSALALATVAAPAVAAPQAGEETVTVRISYADVDVITEEGQATLVRRVDAQLRDACRLDVPYRLGRTVIDEKCVSDARTLALAEVARVAAAERRASGQIAAN